MNVVYLIHVMNEYKMRFQILIYDQTIVFSQFFQAFNSSIINSYINFKSITKWHLNNFIIHTNFWFFFLTPPPPALISSSSYSLPSQNLSGISEKHLGETMCMSHSMCQVGLPSKRILREGLVCKLLIRGALDICGEGDGTPLQYSCLENPMDGGALWAAVHGVTKSRTQLSDFTFTLTFVVGIKTRQDCLWGNVRVQCRSGDRPGRPKWSLGTKVTWRS